MTKRSDDILSGAAEIAAYLHKSIPTIMDWIRSEGLPASKINGGIWESSKELVDSWRRRRIMIEIGVVEFYDDVQTRPELPFEKHTRKERKWRKISK